MALNNFHTPGPQTDVRNLMLAQLNQSGLANNIFNSALGEMNKFDTGARNLNTQKLTRDIANMSLSELEDYYNNGRTAIGILNDKDGTGFMYNETDPNLLNMVNQRDNDYKTAKNNIVFHELQQMSPQQILDSGNLYDKFAYADKLTPLQEAWLTNAKGSAQKSLRTQALNELSPEEIADAQTVGNIKLDSSLGAFDSQDAESFRALQDKYKGELDSKNYGLATQLLNSIPNPLDRARLVNNPSEFRARLEQAGIKFRNGETFTRLISDLGATYNDPNKKAELDKIFDDQITSEIAAAIQDGKSLSDVASIVNNAVNSQGNHLTEQQKADKLNYILDKGNFINKAIKKFNKNDEEFRKNYDALTDETLTDEQRAAALDYFKNNVKHYIKHAPKEYQPYIKNKLISTLEDTYKKSNLAIEQAAKTRTTEATRNMMSSIQNISDPSIKTEMEEQVLGNGGSLQFSTLKEGKYKGVSDDEIKGGIMQMLELMPKNDSMQQLQKFLADPQNRKSSLGIYFFNKLVPAYAAFRSNSTPEGAKSDGVIQALNSKLAGINEGVKIIKDYKIYKNKGSMSNIYFMP
jgi:hypothetical protein